MEITLEETVDEMVKSLKYEADNYGIKEESIRKLFANQEINSLDDLFGDGGEVRCESFVDLALDYAVQFGEFDGTEFHEALWDAISKAMEVF